MKKLINDYEVVNESDKAYMQDCLDHHNSVKGTVIDATKNSPAPNSDLSTIKDAGKVDPLLRIFKRVCPDGDPTHIEIPYHPTQQELQVYRELKSWYGVDSARFPGTRAAKSVLLIRFDKYVAKASASSLPTADDFYTIPTSGPFVQYAFYIDGSDTPVYTAEGVTVKFTEPIKYSGTIVSRSTEVGTLSTNLTTSIVEVEIADGSPYATATITGIVYGWFCNGQHAASDAVFHPSLIATPITDINMHGSVHIALTTA